MEEDSNPHYTFGLPHFFLSDAPRHAVIAEESGCESLLSSLLLLIVIIGGNVAGLFTPRIEKNGIYVY